MKKWLLIAGAIAIAGVVYFLIPSKRALSSSVIGIRTMSPVARCFKDTARWDAWWPRAAGYAFSISRLSYGDAQVTVRWDGGHHMDGHLRIAPLNGDSVLINWEGDVPRREAEEGKRAVDTILRAFKGYVEDAKRLYGVDFFRTMSQDSVLAAIIYLSPVYPDVREVYQKIDSLRQYIASRGAREMNVPMLNVTQLGAGRYRVTVAISVNRSLPAKGTIVPNRFVPWKMVEGKVHGGISTVERAFKEMWNFKADYNLQIMAMPFQSLITDRRQEPDTTKWVTMVCAPIS